MRARERENRGGAGTCGRDGGEGRRGGVGADSGSPPGRSRREAADPAWRKGVPQALGRRSMASRGHGCRQAKARRSGGSLAHGVEWRGRWTRRSGFAVVGGDRRGSTEGGGSNGASSPAADSAKREAGGGRPRPARRRRHPGEFITICCCSTTTAADQIDLPRHLEDQQILDLPWRGWRARPQLGDRRGGLLVASQGRPAAPGGRGRRGAAEN